MCSSPLLRLLSPSLFPEPNSNRFLKPDTLFISSAPKFSTAWYLTSLKLTKATQRDFDIPSRQRVPKHLSLYLPAVQVRLDLRASISTLGTDKFWLVGKNEAACAADATREVVERWLPDG